MKFKAYTMAELAAMDLSPERVSDMEHEYRSSRDRHQSPTSFLRAILWDHLYTRMNPVQCWRDLPRERGIYVIEQCGPCSRELIYIGRAIDLRERWSKHQLRAEYERTREWSLMWASPDSATYSSLDHEEATYIVLFKPRLNRLINCVI